MSTEKPKSTQPSSSCPPFAKQIPEGEWSTGLFDCREDTSNCVKTCFCPCITMGQIVEILDGGVPSSGRACCIYYFVAKSGCGWLYAATYRAKLRKIFSLPEAPSTDELLHCFCCVCSLSQEYRELKNRGLDPSLGWEASVEKWHQEGLKPPIVAPGMAR